MFAAWSWTFHRHRDRVAVIFHTENHRQLAQRRGIHCLPEFTFTGGSVAERNVGDLVPLKRNILELPIVDMAGWPILRVLCEGWDCRNLRCLRTPRKISSPLSASHSLQNL